MKYTSVTITAILCITGLAALALSLGHNGFILLSAITLISGLGGYSVGKRKGKPVLPATMLPQPKKGDTDLP